MTYNKQPDAEQLREEYNSNYSGEADRWSVNSLSLARRIICVVIRRLGRLGLTVSPGMRSLDVGCAKGHITESLRLAGFESWGLDYSEVAVERAAKNFPNCRFVHMDGFNPSFDETFHLIMVRGFSGANTHDLDFVGGFSNRYVELLEPGGFYVLGFNTDFSGREAPGETACWSLEEMEILSWKIKAGKADFFLHPPKTPWVMFKRLVQRMRGRKVKDYFYLVYKKPEEASS